MISREQKIPSESKDKKSEAHSHKLLLEQMLKIPDDFICPITYEIMRDPVITAEGHSFERTAIEAWFRQGHRTNPLTNVVLPNLTLIPNVNMRNAIQNFNELGEQLKKQSDSKKKSSIKHYKYKTQEPLYDLLAAAEEGLLADVQYAIKRNPNIVNSTANVYNPCLFLSGIHPSNDRSTALILAASAGHFDIVKYLVLDAKADVNLKNSKGLTAVDYSDRNGHEAITNFLIWNGAKYGPGFSLNGFLFGY